VEQKKAAKPLRMFIHKRLLSSAALLSLFALAAVMTTAFRIVQP
jgi:hypothetical protein